MICLCTHQIGAHNPLHESGAGQCGVRGCRCLLYVPAHQGFHRGQEVEISRSDDVTGRLIFGDAWEQFKATLPDDGVYGMTLQWDVVGSVPMSKTIKPTMHNDRGGGSWSVRVVGDDVEAMRDALERGTTVKLDPPGGTFRPTGMSLAGDAGFFDVDAVEEDEPVTSPGRQTRRAKNED